jgi:hypothetical protein
MKEARIINQNDVGMLCIIGYEDKRINVISRG